MAEQSISKRQITALQVGWAKLCAAQSLGSPSTLREARLAYVGGLVGRQLESFKALSRSEGNTAIAQINACLPEAERIKAKRRRRPDREQALRYGTAGRKGYRHDKVVELVDATTLGQLERVRNDLGWSQVQLDAWVRSKHGPGRLDTIPQCNRAIWSLRAMVRRKKKPTAVSPQSTAQPSQEATPF